MIGGMVAALPRNGDLADRFDQLADLSEILGEQPFRIGAYRRAALRIRDTASSVAESICGTSVPIARGANAGASVRR